MTSVTRALLRFSFNTTATTEIYTLSLHDALPIYDDGRHGLSGQTARVQEITTEAELRELLGTPLPRVATRNARRSTRSTSRDRKSTRLNSSHVRISYAVFCLKKKISTPNLPTQIA